MPKHRVPNGTSAGGTELPSQNARIRRILEGKRTHCRELDTAERGQIVISPHHLLSDPCYFLTRCEPRMLRESGSCECDLIVWCRKRIVQEMDSFGCSC